MNVKDISGCTAKVQLFRMSDRWKKDDVVNVAKVSKNGEIMLPPTKNVPTNGWSEDCLILSLDIIDGPSSGTKVLLWPLSNSDADSPGVMNMYLPKWDANVEIEPSKFHEYPSD